MSIEFLVSTINKTNLGFLDTMFQHTGLDGFEILVINQCINIPRFELKHKNKNIRCISVEEKGLSKSRNIALKNAKGEICVITDDDVVYLPGAIEAVKKAFEKCNSDILTFQTKTTEGKDYKKYKKKSFQIKYPLQKMKVSSIEIAFRRKSVIDKRLIFNEQLGLGAKYPGAEEIVFIHECIKKGLIANFIPVPIVAHPKESSSIYFTSNKVISNGILFAKLFPFSFLFVDIYFTVKRYPRYKKDISFFKHLYSLIQGNILELMNSV